MTRTIHVDTAEQAFAVLRTESRKGPARQCSDCQLCCKLLPVPPLKKKAGQKCEHQKFGKGCAVYLRARMPNECRIWNCRWLVNDDTADLSRPDRAHYVIDIMPDRITLQENATGITHEIFVVQVWIDPNHPEVVHDKHLRAYMLRRAQQDGMATLIRFDSARSLTVFPPPLSSDGEWHEKAGVGSPEFPGLFR